MSEQTNDPTSEPRCPICGGPVVAGHFVARGFLQWLPGEPGFWKDLFNMGGHVGTASLSGYITLTGIHCQACHRIIVNDS